MLAQVIQGWGCQADHHQTGRDRGRALLWLDRRSQLAPLDNEYFLVRMTPRRRGSRWSRKNRDAADQLLAQGRIRPAGIAEIEAAKGDGRWAGAYASQGKAEVPADLVAALTRNKSAAAFFLKNWIALTAMPSSTG